PAAPGRWGELGLTADWENLPIHAYTGELGQGRLDFVREVALLDGEWSPSIHQVAHDEDVVTAVAKDRAGICIAALAFATKEVRSVALAAEDGGTAYAPTKENVAQRHYPLSRVVYIYINVAPGRPIEPLTREFLRIALGREGQAEAQ